MYREKNYQENCQENYERNYESLVKSSLEKLATGLGDYSIIAKEMNQRMKVSDFPRLET